MENSLSCATKANARSLLKVNADAIPYYTRRNFIHPCSFGPQVRKAEAKWKRLLSLEPCGNSVLKLINHKISSNDSKINFINDD